MGIKIDFGIEKFNELDFIVLNDILQIIKKEIQNTSENSCKIVYNYRYLLIDFTKNQIMKSIKNFYKISILIGNTPVRLFLTMEICETEYEIIFEIINLKYLREYFFIDNLFKKD